MNSFGKGITATPTSCPEQPRLINETVSGHQLKRHSSVGTAINVHHAFPLFSPSGKLVQIEYALNAVAAGNTSIGIKGGSILVLSSDSVLSAVSFCKHSPRRRGDRH